jgi:hypothetical protein
MAAEQEPNGRQENNPVAAEYARHLRIGKLTRKFHFISFKLKSISIEQEFKFSILIIS